MGRRLTQQQRWDRAITEAQLQATITDALDLYGWRWHHETDSRRSKSGFPDIVACHPKTGALLFLELKTETGRVQPEQQAWLDALVVHTERAYDEECMTAAMLVRPSDLDDTLTHIKNWGSH